MAETRGHRRRGAWRAALVPIALVVFALACVGCFRGSGVPGEYGPMLDRMERAIPSITRAGRESSGGGSCTPDGEEYPFVERQYLPKAGVSTLEVEQAIYDHFVNHGFPDDEAELGPHPGNLDWTLFGDPDSTELSVTNEDEHGTPSDLVTVHLESNTC